MPFFDDVGISPRQEVHKAMYYIVVHKPSSLCDTKVNNKTNYLQRKQQATMSGEDWIRWQDKRGCIWIQKFSLKKKRKFSCPIHFNYLQNCQNSI